MKTLIKLILIIMAAALLSLGCRNTSTEAMNDKDEQNTHFNTSAEAAQKGKSDMLELMKRRPEMDFGISQADLENATLATEVSHYMIDFEKLTNADSSTTINMLSSEEVNTITPLVNGNHVVQVIFTRESENGWQIAGLGDRELANELDVLRSVTSENLVLYEIPNIHVHFYKAGEGENEIYYTNHKGRGLREGASLNQIIPELLKAAVQFKEKFGEKMKDQKLVR